MTVRVKATEQNVPYELVSDKQGPIDEANQFLEANHVRGLSPNTIRAYAFDLAVLYRWLSETGRQLGQLEHADLLQLIRDEQSRGASARSINRRLTSCRLLYRFWMDRDIPIGKRAILPAPYYRGPGRDHVIGIHKLRKPRHLKPRVSVPHTLVEPLTREQVCLALQCFRRYRDLLIVELMLLCGLRSAEVLSVQLEDVSFESRHIRVCGKGGRHRVLPLPDVLIATLNSYLFWERPRRCSSPYLLVVLQGKRRGQPMIRSGLRSLFRQRRRKRKLCNANPHRFRHTFGSDMARAGVRLPVLQKMMGHSKAETTLQYINLSMADVATEFHRAHKLIQCRYEGER